MKRNVSFGTRALKQREGTCFWLALAFLTAFPACSFPVCGGDTVAEPARRDYKAAPSF